MLFQTMTTSDLFPVNNMTTMSFEIDRGWYIAYNVILVSITIIIMFSMGTSITLSYLKTIIRRPVAPVIGAFCQV